MKTTLKYQLLLTLVAASLTLPLCAQNTNTGTNDAAPPPPPGGPGQHGPMANLSAEERQKIKAAHDAAIQKDPALEQVMKEAHEAMERARNAMHEAMIAVDPTVEPILAKITPPKWGGGGGDKGNGGRSPEGNDAKPWKHEGPGKGMANLTESEREQLKAAHEKVKNDPAVAAAHEAMKNATTPEARRTAEEGLHKASREAMIKADSSIAPILEKLHPSGGGVNGGQQTNAETTMQAQ